MRGLCPVLVPGTRTWYSYLVRSSPRIGSLPRVHADSQQYRYRCTGYRYLVRRIRRAPRASHGATVARVDAVQGTGTSYIGTSAVTNPLVLARQPLITGSSVTGTGTRYEYAVRST